MSEPRIFLSAGETSGDLHGATLARALRRLYPDAELLGLAGPRMVEAGVRPIIEFEPLVVMGLAEIATRLPFFFKLRRRIRTVLQERPPDLVIPIDYPGVNLRLAQEARGVGSSVLYYIAPQLWAWRPGRVRVLAENTDRVATVFPHEEPFLRKFGVEAVFVGHPLLDHKNAWERPEEAIAALGFDSDHPILGLLPGSRPQEVQRLLGPFLAVADAVVDSRPEVQVAVAKAPEVPDHLYNSAKRYTLAADSHRVLSAASAVLTKSGTTTVEAALTETPLVIAHRVHPWTYAVARRLVKVENVGMVNILAGRKIVPEFIQHLPRERIAAELMALIDRDSTERRVMVDALRRVTAMLGTPGAPERVARLATELLDARS